MKGAMNRLTAIFARFAIVFALAFAMATSGFAHRIAAADVDESLQSYVAAGGSLADICGDIGASLGETCDACRLVDTAFVPPLSSHCQSAIDAKIAAVIAVVHLPDVANASDPSRLVRAPPIA